MVPGMWADVVAWLQSSGGARVLQTAIVPAVAILVAGIVAALIARAAVRSAIARADREQAVAAVAGLVEAARGTTGEGRRRAERLRTEADVRLRLLPLAGAATAADWAASRIDELQQAGTEAPSDVALLDLRDRLVAWVARPSGARRIFAQPAPALGTSARARPENAEQVDAAGRQQAAADPAVDRSGRKAAKRQRSHDPAPPAEDVPAWRRTRSVERLQQERSARRETRAQEGAGSGPAPRDMPSTSSTVDAPSVDAQQAARHAAPPEPAAQPSAPARDGGTAAPVAPAWLDQYDDEAQVTQNMDLKTPPPVAATSVRDRSPSGEDIVPRT